MAFMNLGAGRDSLTREQIEMIALGEKIARQLNDIKKTRGLTQSEQAVYNVLKQAQDSQDAQSQSGMSGFNYESEGSPYSMFSQYQGFSGFGRNFFTPLTTTLKRATKVVVAPVTVVRKLTQGNIKGATRDALDMVNPVVAVSKIATDNPKLLDYARISSPTSVVNIQDRDLRKKAAVGYAAAAVIAGAAYAAGVGGASAAAAPASTAAPAAAAVTGASSALTTAATAVGTAGAAVKVGQAAGLIKTPDEQPQERAGMGFPEDRVETEIQHGMGTPTKIAIGIGGAGLLGFAIWYMTKKR